MQPLQLSLEKPEQDSKACLYSASLPATLLILHMESEGAGCSGSVHIFHVSSEVTTIWLFANCFVEFVF